MNNFDFCNPVRVLFGKGMIARLEELVPAGSRVLLLYGGGSIKKNNVYSQVKKALAGVEIKEFGGIEANPRYESCMKAVKLVQKAEINFLLAVGGGSVIDAAKFIAAAALYRGEPWDILARGGEIREALPLGAVVTLAATGSEMNERAVISREATREKLNFSSPKVFPQFAILDPTVTYSLPTKQVINGVVDSFIHVVEQYLTYPVNAKVQDAFAESLMRVILEEGEKVLQFPFDYDIRANLMWAATNALNGWIGQGVPQDWSSHRIGYALTAQFGLDHAETLAVILPGVLTYMSAQKEEKLVQMGAHVFDLNNGSKADRAQATIKACEAFFRNMGLKTRLSEYGIQATDLDALVEPVKQMNWKLGEAQTIDWHVARQILASRL